MLVFPGALFGEVIYTALSTPSMEMAKHLITTGY